MKSIAMLCLIATCPAFGQSADQSEGVKRAVLYYVEGFYEGDTIKLKRGISPTLYKYGYWQDANTKKFGGEQMTFKQAVDYARGVKEKKRFAKSDAPKKIVILDVEEQVAAAKLTAWWGIDYLLLSKQGDAWVIDQVLWQGPLTTIKAQ